MAERVVKLTVVNPRLGRYESCADGIGALLDLLVGGDGMLDGADVRDTIVGKGAASLMIAGGVSSVYGGVMSRRAVELFASHGVRYEAGVVVDEIRNRAGTGACPVETLVADDADIRVSVGKVKAFVDGMRARAAAGVAVSNG